MRRAHGNAWLGSRRQAIAMLVGGIGVLGGCAAAPITQAANNRPFDFSRDTFGFNNELESVYESDPRTGTLVPVGKNRSSTYVLHCFVLSRSARQFFQFARFTPDRQRLTDDEYKALVRRVVAHDPSKRGASADRIEIAGYADLRAFSADKERLLKEELGGSIHSYIQRGNWRMVFPVSAAHQHRIDDILLTEVRASRPPVIHVFNFPNRTINHAMLAYAAAETPRGTRFEIYDPNDAARPTWLEYDRDSGHFRLAPRKYFSGGAVKVYEVYRSTFY
jgi:hypothetical protein